MTIRSTSIAGLLLGTALILPSSVLAADLIIAPTASYAADLAPYGNAETWSGFYLGAHLGGVTSNDFNQNNSAVIGGIQAGYLHQFDNFVLGAELEASYSDNLQFELQPGAGLSQEWSIAAKARAGFALDQTLIYGLAGVAFTELQPSGATTSAAATHTGFVFGAGIEQAITDNISLRAEYQQTRYFDVNSTVGAVARVDDLTSHALKAGVNFRF